MPFLNDDYQLLGFHNKRSLWAILSLFWSKDLTVVYWRPLANILHPIILFIAGYNSFVFHFIGVILYGICCILIAKVIESVGVKKEYAVLTAALFAVLPSHDYQVAWIVDQGESLVTIFLLLTFIYYGRNKIIALLFFIAALLSKESSFTGIFIPFLYMFIDNKKEKKKIVYVKDSLIGLAVIVLLQIYRYFVIGGSPVSSGNFQNTGPLKWIANFLIYIPLSFIPPDNLEGILLSKNLALFIFVAAIAAAIIWYSIISFRRLSESKRKIVYLGLAWFIIFIIPALAKMMRWYVFTASVGFAFIFAILAEQVVKKKLFVGILTLIIVFILYSDISRMMTWKESGEKMDGIVNSLKSYKGKSDFVLWCIPEKYNNVPLMKLGVSETVGFAVNNRCPNVTSPLRCEIFSDVSSIEFYKLNDSVIVFTLWGGRFKSLEGASSSFLKTERFSFADDGYKIEVNNGINDRVSKAMVILPPLKKSAANLYFNGVNFMPLSSIL